MFFPGNFLADGLDDEIRRDLLQELPTQDYYARLYNDGPQAVSEQQDAIVKFYEAAVELRNYRNQQQRTLNLHRRFFVTGEAGSGKTFTYNVIHLKISRQIQIYRF